MEAAAQHVSSSSFDFPQHLVADPFLVYLNDILMEESTADRHGLSEDGEASYRTMMDSLYRSIGEPPALDCTSSVNVSAFHLSSGHIPSHDATIYEDVSGDHQTHPCHETGHYEQINITKPCNQLSGFTSKTHNLGFSTCSLPAACNFHGSLEQEKAETLPVKQQAVHNPFSEGKVVAHHRPSEMAYDMKDTILGEVGIAEEQEQCTRNSSLLLSYFTCAPIIDISFEVVKDAVDYASLYVERPSFQNASAVITKGSNKNRNERKALHVGRSHRKCSSKKSPVLCKLIESLMSCAQAVAIGDIKRGRQILQELYNVHGVSDEGNVMQRTAYFFCVALVARMDGMGGHHYRIMRNKVPSAVFLVRTTKLWYKVSPYVKITHYFANQSILKAAEGASILHIVDYGIMDGIQWVCLINALADREGGPPLLIITGIESPGLGKTWCGRIEATGQRLAAYARTYRVPFQFHPIVTEKWEDINPASLQIHKNGVLVINCVRRLRHLPDGAIDPSLPISSRIKLLMSMHGFNPHLLLVADYSSACNSPFFLNRFREALYFYFNRVDSLETLSFQRPERLFVERHLNAREILSIVACEGAERVERPETYRQWDTLIKKAGFERLPIPSVILSRARSHVKQYYHKDYVIDDYANAWMLLGWKGRIIMAMSAWRPISRQ